MANLRVDKITSTETFETTGSVQFDGNGDYLRSTTNLSDYQFGTGDFTVEAWIYKSVNGSNNYDGICAYGTNGSGDDGWFFEASATRGYVFWMRSVEQISFNETPNTSQWIHTAVTRKSGVVRLFVNGVLKQERNSSTEVKTTGTSFDIGVYAKGTGNYYFKGHISNLRVVKGKAFYTADFKPPMREFEVTPETSLLACQSKTDASHEKTGKTFTVNANAVASELTPGILTPVPKAGAGSAITGSIVFDGGDDYLSIPDSEDFYFEDHKFTVELWAYTGTDTTSNRTLFSQWAAGANRNIQFDLRGDASKVWRFYYRTSSTTEFVSGSDPVEPNSWYHIAAVADGTNLKLYVNGILQETNAIAGDAQNSNQALIIGAYSASPEYWWDGYISNLRIVKGTALYTDDFTPPTRELKKVPGTSLLCCQDENSVTTEATGKTISAYGSITASNFTPQVGDDRKVTFEGVTKVNTENYFYLPTGDTESREATGTYNAGTRGVALGGDASSPNPDTIIDYITIASTGDATDFGDLTVSDSLNGDAVADHTRGVCLGGRSNVPTPNSTTNTIQFVTISSTGNSQEFGDLVGVKYGMAGFSDSTRGIAAGGGVTPNSTANIDYITISSKGDAQDFGDCVDALTYSAGFSSPTRGIKAGGAEVPGSAPELNLIEYVTIQTTGNGQDFGDLITPAWRLGGCSNAVRGVILEGESPAGDGLNAISYVTIASMGNAQDFGDATTAGQHSNGTSSSTRGVFMGRQGASPYANLTFIDFVQIMTTANALDFGDLTAGRQGVNACSNGHGGLG